MKKIVSIQHCESIHHKNKMIGSWTDWELNENGIEQAHNIGRNLKKEGGYENYVLYSSDLKRAKMTANIVGKYLGLKPVIVKDLRERNLGIANNKSSEWFRENADLSTWDVDHYPIEESESVRDHYNRVKKFYDIIINNDEENIIFVSHGGTVSVFNTMMLKQPVEYMNEVNIHGKAGSVSKYRIEEKARFIETIGDISYRNK